MGYQRREQWRHLRVHRRERPDKFRKVFSTLGSFTNIRGGHIYPCLIRLAEKKPIRVFQQDGANDLDNQAGNWPLANKMIDKALSYMKCDHQFVLGDGQHNSKHGASIFPEAIKWLWRKRTRRGPVRCISSRDQAGLARGFDWPIFADCEKLCRICR